MKSIFLKVFIFLFSIFFITSCFDSTESQRQIEFDRAIQRIKDNNEARVLVNRIIDNTESMEDFSSDFWSNFNIYSDIRIPDTTLNPMAFDSLINWKLTVIFGSTYINDELPRKPDENNDDDAYLDRLKKLIRLYLVGEFEISIFYCPADTMNKDENITLHHDEFYENYSGFFWKANVGDKTGSLFSKSATLLSCVKFDLDYDYLSRQLDIKHPKKILYMKPVYKKYVYPGIGKKLIPFFCENDSPLGKIYRKTFKTNEYNSINNYYEINFLPDTSLRGWYIILIYSRTNKIVDIHYRNAQDIYFKGTISGVDVNDKSINKIYNYLKTELKEYNLHDLNYFLVNNINDSEIVDYFSKSSKKLEKSSLKMKEKYKLALYDLSLQLQVSWKIFKDLYQILPPSYGGPVYIPILVKKEN